jgi:acylphosphatase
MTMKIRVHCFIGGRVQRVGFRNFTKKNAERMYLKGWVKNLPDGRVEIMAEGELEEIKKFIRALNKGPLLSKVEKIITHREKYTGEFKGFEIIK